MPRLRLRQLQREAHRGRIDYGHTRKPHHTRAPAQIVATPSDDTRSAGSSAGLKGKDANEIMAKALIAVARKTGRTDILTDRLCDAGRHAPLFESIRAASSRSLSRRSGRTLQRTASSLAQRHESRSMVADAKARKLASTKFVAGRADRWRQTLPIVPTLARSPPRDSSARTALRSSARNRRGG